MFLLFLNINDKKGIGIILLGFSSNKLWNACVTKKYLVPVEVRGNT